MQRECTKYNNGILNSFKTIFREEGLLGFYKGNGANCARVVRVSFGPRQGPRFQAALGGQDVCVGGVRVSRVRFP